VANGTVVTPGSLVPWLTEAMIERAVFGPGNRVECSVTARLFTGATRRAVEVRDRYCRDGSDEPAEVCDVDHILPYGLGGPTTQENGEMACRFHNLLRNRRREPP
jgi:hypothetical protein